VRRSYYEANARQRIAGILDDGTFEEFLPPSARVVSPHLHTLGLPVAFDDGVAVGRGQLSGQHVLIAAQEGGFMGGAVGEVQGAKIVGLLQRAERERPAGVVLLVESGGVRLQEANAGLIAVSEVMRAILSARVLGIPVVAAIGGQYGCFGGMGIAVPCCNAVIMSEQGRLGLSGPEVIESARGVEEFDSRDRALVWRTVGGKHRYLIGDASVLVDDDVATFRSALVAAIASAQPLTLESVEREHALLTQRLDAFGGLDDGIDVWRALGWSHPESVPLADTDVFLATAQSLAQHRMPAESRS
jgi:malonate decarboxylase beta subunit